MRWLNVFKYFSQVPMDLVMRARGWEGEMETGKVFMTTVTVTEMINMKVLKEEADMTVIIGNVAVIMIGLDYSSCFSPLFRLDFLKQCID
jgi:hypothetical protein